MFNYENLFPILGNIVGNILGLSLLQTSSQIKKEKTLGTLNPCMFPIVTNYCLSWVIYAIVTHDVYVFFSLVVTMFASFEIILTVYQFISCDNQKRSFTILLLIFPLVFYIYIYWYVFLCKNIDTARFVIGILCSTLQVLYYFSPLVSIQEVITSKSSESMYFPLVFTNVVNSFLWLAYSLLIKDPFQFIPNIISAIISVIQLILYLMYFKRNVERSSVEEPLMIC